jgi:hypothetical protein
MLFGSDCNNNTLRDVIGVKRGDTVGLVNEVRNHRIAPLHEDVEDHFTPFSGHRNYQQRSGTRPPRQIRHQCQCGFRPCCSLTRFAQFIAVYSASILAETLRIPSLLRRQSRENRGALSRPIRAHVCQLQPTTNSDKLSGTLYADRYTRRKVTE